MLSLVRNSANVSGVAVATTIVTATMVSMGYAPDLGDVRSAVDAGVLNAFVSGLRLLYTVMGSLLLVGIAVSFFKGAKSALESRTPMGDPEARAAD